MYGRSNSVQRLRVTVRYGLELTVTRVKSYGSLRCVFRHRNTVTTPEPLAGRYEGRKTTLPYYPKTVWLNDKPFLGMMGRGCSHG